MIIPLAVSASATFNVAGVARASLGPTVFGSKWTVDRVAVVTTSTVDTECNMYRNVESDTALLDGTPNGNNDTSETSIKVGTGESLLIVWTGGTSGAVATVTLGGDVETGRVR